MSNQRLDCLSMELFNCLQLMNPCSNKHILYIHIEIQLLYIQMCVCVRAQVARAMCQTCSVAVPLGTWLTPGPSFEGWNPDPKLHSQDQDNLCLFKRSMPM